MRDKAKTGRLRRKLIEKLGEAAMIDAAGVAAAFHGNVRVADATGAPTTIVGKEQANVEFQDEVGISEFYSA